MTTPTRQPPRFVPTLTEVVIPPLPTPGTALGQVEAEALAAEIWQQIQPLLMHRLQQETEQWLRATLAQHLHEMTARVQRDMASLVRQAAMDALDPQNRPKPTAAPDNS
ncbi:hypothetical protein [Rhodoferax sp.]|uniref:hypothetical protein n=1 Tax=Rhodoferax sp. TaxID=50421 RepID=UPI002727D1E8|nr:hypothetical protein [Rhodoferax sp.]MDO8318473.1 hypothetical protein [Rhodoferax sp.]